MMVTAVTFVLATVALFTAWMILDRKSMPAWIAFVHIAIAIAAFYFYVKLGE